MRIEIRKFGEILISRPSGREAALIMSAMQPSSKDEAIELDFSGVQVVGPSWLDEVLTALRDKFGERIAIKPTENPTIHESLKVLALPRN